MLKSELIDRLQRSLSRHGDGPVKLAETAWVHMDMSLEDIVESPESGGLFLVFQDDVPMSDDGDGFRSALNIIERWASSPSYGDVDDMVTMAAQVAQYLGVSIEHLCYLQEWPGSLFSRVKRFVDPESAQSLAGVVFERYKTLSLEHSGHVLFISEMPSGVTMWTSEDVATMLEDLMAGLVAGSVSGET